MTADQAAAARAALNRGNTLAITVREDMLRQAVAPQAAERLADRRSGV